VLLVLWEEDGLLVKEIGKRLELDSGTLTPLLKRLENQGLVARERQQNDQRQVRIRLSPTGRALEKKALAVPKQLACRYGVSLSTHREAEQLREALNGLRSHLRSET